MQIDDAWLEAAIAEVSSDQLVGPDELRITQPVERIQALFDAWAIGFAAQRDDVPESRFQYGSRGWHPDECAAFIRAMDARRVHVDSAGYAWPLCAEPKRGQQRYALCCKSGDGVTVNLEYLIQLAAVAELASQHHWPRDQLRIELGEFDGGALDADGRAVVLMEAKCRAASRLKSDDTLEKLLRAWLRYAKGPPPPRGENAANKYVFLLEHAEVAPVTVLLAAAGARWWLRARAEAGRLHLEEAAPLGP